MSAPLHKAKRIVIKIGSALLVDSANGHVHRAWLESVAEDIARLRVRGVEVCVVSSGAVAVGRRHLGLKGALRLDEKQAAAAAGQIRLAHAYQEVLAKHDITVAQVLLTLDDSENRRRYLNARNTFLMLLKLGAVPLVNENDTVATHEIRFGDNDRLAARVAEMMGADTLVLLSDIDGLYSADPRSNADARHIPEVREITPEIESMAGGVGSNVGSGGMVTKLLAARIAIRAGCHMAIAPGAPMHPLKAVEDGGRCTWFLASTEPKTARKRWIAGALAPMGAFIVDAGALKALAAGKSLLPAGVLAVEGDFQKGEPVLIKTQDGAVAARGLSAYAAEDARLLAGRKSGEIESLLGYRGRDELVHRDDMVVEDNAK